MNKLNPKPIDIINVAIAEIYGNQAVDLLKAFSKLKNDAKFNLIEYVKWMSESEKYKKATMIRISENQEEHRV